MDPSCSIPSPAASPTATLDTILVQKSFLVRLSAAYFDPADSEIHKFTQLARTANPHFFIIHKFSVALLVQQVNLEVSLQLIIP